MKRTGRVLAASVLALAMFVIGGIGLRRARPEAPAVAAASAESLSSATIESGTLVRLISSLQTRLRAVPEDWRTHASLGLAYVQQARVSGDPSYYPKAEAVLERSLSLNERDNFEGLTGMAALALARHDFADALNWATRARGINDYNANIHGVMGDALVELGRYEEAFEEFQRMVDLRPGLSSYARVSYARELRGDVDGAIDAMKLAVEGAGTRQDTAWASHQLGELYFNSGRLEEAAEAYRFAQAADPAFVAADAGIAKVAAARGQRGRAIRRYESIVARSPVPEHVIALGDLYMENGQHEQAQRQYDLVLAQQALYEANGVNVDVETALFNADHRRDVGAALSAARTEWSRRKSIAVADTLAWALYVNGRPGDALRYARLALRLGTRSALFLFHRGMIHRTLGHDGAARSDLSRALEINPHFSILWAPRARAVLEKLEGGAS